MKTDYVSFQMRDHIDHRLKFFQIAYSTYGCIACVHVRLGVQIIRVITREQSWGIAPTKRNGDNNNKL